mmetsp:Transcript_33951/g.66792  ORF Transcript_33951/g.66792 Transcript_33951/m.66792 type:complete len:208 (+) Transcript_33951:568-1191(+)
MGYHSYGLQLPQPATMSLNTTWLRALRRIQGSSSSGFVECLGAQQVQLCKGRVGSPFIAASYSRCSEHTGICGTGGGCRACAMVPMEGRVAASRQWQIWQPELAACVPPARRESRSADFFARICSRLQQQRCGSRLFWPVAGLMELLATPGAGRSSWERVDVFAARPIQDKAKPRSAEQNAAGKHTKSFAEGGNAGTKQRSANLYTD